MEGPLQRYDVATRAEEGFCGGTDAEGTDLFLR